MSKFYESTELIIPLDKIQSIVLVKGREGLEPLWAVLMDGTTWNGEEDCWNNCSYINEVTKKILNSRWQKHLKRKESEESDEPIRKEFAAGVSEILKMKEVLDRDIITPEEKHEFLNDLREVYGINKREFKLPTGVAPLPHEKVGMISGLDRPFPKQPQHSDKEKAKEALNSRTGVEKADWKVTVYRINDPKMEQSLHTCTAHHMSENEAKEAGWESFTWGSDKRTILPRNMYYIVAEKVEEEVKAINEVRKDLHVGGDKSIFPYDKIDKPEINLFPYLCHAEKMYLTSNELEQIVIDRVQEGFEFKINGKPVFYVDIRALIMGRDNPKGRLYSLDEIKEITSPRLGIGTVEQLIEMYNRNRKNK